ncbi:MAG: PASTA domain-containing protein [Thermoleophilia bacterium]
MTYGPGTLMADRFELVREIGGGEMGSVWVARDRHLGGREVALRLVHAADPGVLLEEARWMGDAHAHTPAAIAVLDIIPTAGGGGYVASELVPGTPLEEVARRRAPLPVSEAAGYGVELLDAVITLRKYVPGAERAVVGSALVGTDGRIRVTRFSRPPAEVGAADGAVVGTAQTLRDLLSGSRPPASLSATIDDALAGRITGPEELRGRLLTEVTPEAPTVVAPPPPPIPPHRNRWPWIIAAIAVVLAVAVALGIFFATRDDNSSTQQVAVPDVVGFTQDAAVTAVQGAGFDTKIAQGQSDKVAEGLVISTTPPAGQKADTGSTVTITVSQGSGNVSIPTVIGTTQEEATAVLQQAGLESRVVEQESAAASGTVISQQPAGGLQVPKGSTVAITVAIPQATTSTGTVTAPPSTVAVPDVTGLTSEEASTQLIAAGLQPGKVTEASSADGVAPGQITAQNPAAGTQVAPRTKVDVTVAPGG